MNRILASAQLNGYQWVFIDTAPTTWLVVQEAIRAATLLLIPVRPGFFDLAAVRETVSTARELGKPYAVVINAAPVKREDKEAPAVAHSRAQFDALSIPVWSGQISQRAGYVLTLAAGSSIGEVAPDSAAGVEIAGLWSAIDRSVAAINEAHAASAAHGQAA
jgi:chromosome partitioning protein